MFGMSIQRKRFGTLPDGRAAEVFTLKNSSGLCAEITDYGGAVIRLMTPDREGRFSDIVCGYDSLNDYVAADGYQGALIGRFGNRIARGKFTLDGKEYYLARNNGDNHLHGGECGFSHRLWHASTSDGHEPSIMLTYNSPDGEEGYPGNLKVTVTYTLTADNRLSIEYSAQTDKKTILNLTNHTYFNLGGYASGSVYEHILQLDADTYLPTDAGLIPTGELRDVSGTPFDFRVPKVIGRDIETDDKDLVTAGGYDHCFNFIGGASDTPRIRGELYSPATGRVMELYTDRPAVQFYTGNFMTNSAYPFKGGLPQRKQHALCLETQGMPDSINHPGFTDCTLSPGEIFKSRTEYKFSVR